MFFNKIAFQALAAAAVAFTSVHAAPVEAGDVVTLNRRVDGHLFVCTDNNFTGICTNLAFNINQCINLVSPFQDTISSFGPDKGFICITYTNNNCQGSTYTGTNPGFGSLPSGINDAISSFQCFHQ